jgi:hypothetical protein
VARPGLYSNGNPCPDYPEAYLEPSVVEWMAALIGRDPRTIPIEQLNGLGHEKQPLLRVIRTNCIECVGGSEAEVRRCRLLHCPFWPYRMASNPFTAPRSEAQLAHAKNRGAALRKATRLEHEILEGPPQGYRATGGGPRSRFPWSAVRSAEHGGSG